MDRRKFLLLSLATGGSLTLGRGFLAPAFAAPAQPGDRPYGPLQPPDANGLRLPEGFTSRVVKQGGHPIGTTGEVAMPFPDGAAVFPTAGGGWILVSNSENPPPADQVNQTPLSLDHLGGVQAIVFSADGEIVDAYPILTGSRSNCAGGATPWGTWLSCEEVEDPDDAANSGRVYECDPTGEREAVDLPSLGRFKHESAIVDPDGGRLYLTEDIRDGCFYRFTPTSYPDLREGVLEAARLDGDTVTWLEIPDPTCSDGVACRLQAPEATRFDGGEGCAYDDGKVFVTTKGDDRVWMYDVAAETMVVLYDGSTIEDPVLSGVDNLIVQPGTGNLLVAEDGGSMEVVMIRRSDFAVFPVVHMTGPQHGFPDVKVGSTPVASEVSGLAFNPAGDRLYVNSQRAFLSGITYEIEGPWLPESSDPTTTGSSATALPRATPGGQAIAGAQLPETGGAQLAPLAAGASAAAAGALALRRRLDRRLPDAG